ncbi:MAG: hypothetical protein KIS67_23055 [Verrucomicrobiae bacterium]|nr:hypothetical protein [Verrucomicrobiae bacterium]
MKRTVLKIAGLSLLAAAIALAPGQGFAQEKQPEKAKSAASEKAAPKGERPLPFRGKVGAINKTAKTVTVGERVFHITADTRIIKGGKPAKLEDGVIGDEIGGSYRKAEDGKLVAAMVRFGPAPEGATKAKKKGEGAAEGKKKAVQTE